MRMNYFKLKFLLLFFALAVALPPAWAETKTAGFTLSGTKVPIAANANPATTTITGTQGETWNVAINGTFTSSSMQGAADRKYWQMGKSKASITSATFSTSGISGNIKSIAIDCAVANGPGGSVSAIVGNSSFGSSELPKWENSTSPFHGDVVTLENSSNYQGDIVITIVPSNQNGCFIHSITVTYEEGGDTPPAEENIYQKVTNASQLVAGKTYIIVNESANVGMGAVDDNRYGTVVTGLEFADGKVNIGGTEVTELTLGGKKDAWTFMQPDNKYLARGNGDNKFLLASSPTTNISKWTIDLSSNGCSIINNDNSDESYRYIRYENNRFDISYESNVALYVKYEGGDTPPTDDPTIEVDRTQLTINDKDENNTFTVTGSNLIDNVGVTASEGFSTNVTYLEYNSGSAEGTVKVTYTGRDLYAQGTVEMGTDKDATGEDITETVSVTYQSDIYIVNNHGDNSWNFGEGIKMTYNDGVYTGTFTAENANTKIVFARMLGDGVDFDTRLVFGAESNEDWLYGTNTSGNLNLNDDVAIHFPLAGTYTITIDANAKTFSIASSSVNNIAEALAYEGDTFTYMGSAIVTYQNGEYLWIRDNANNSGVIKGNVDADDLVNGDILATGWTAENATEHNYIPIFSNPNGVAKGEGTAVADPFPLTKLDRETDVNKYASMSGVTVTAVDRKKYTVTLDGNESVLYDQFSLFTSTPIEVGNKYNVEGVVSVYSGTPQLYLTKVEEIKELKVTLESETKNATIGDEIPVTVNVENAEGDYTVTYKFGENGVVNTLTGNTINVTSETAGEVTLIVTVTNGDNQATAQETYTFTEPVQPGSNVFTKVTSSTLEPGKKYILALANTTSAKAMGAINTSNHKGDIINDLTLNGDGTIDISGHENEVVVFTVDGELKNYTFALPSGNYLRWTSSTNIEESSSTDDNAKWSAVVDGEKGYYIRNNATADATTKRAMMFRGTYISAYSTSDTQSEFAYLYVQTASTPEPEPLAVTLTAAPEQAYTVGDKVTVTATVENGTENTAVTYKIGEGEWQNYPEGGIVLPNTAAGDVVVTVKATDGTNEATDKVTYHFNAAKTFEITLTATPAQETYKVNDVVNVKVAVANALVENPTITYTIGETREAATYDPETGINVTSATAGTVKLTVNVTDGYEHAGESTATADYVFVKKDATLSFGETTSFTVYAGNNFTAPELTTDPEGLAPITYSIEGNENEIVLFDEKDGTVVVGNKTGTVAITATFAGNDTYNKATASYTLNIIKKEVATLSFGETTSFTVYPDADFTAPTLTTTPEGLAPITYSSDNENVAMVDDKTGEVVIGDKTGKATITATFAGNDTYGTATATYTVTVEPRPIVVADKVVEFELYVGQTGTKTFTVMAENLKGDITLTLNDETGFYSIEPTTIDMDDAENATVTVTYAPTTEGFHEATVTLSTKDTEENVTVTLTGMAEVQPVVAMPTFSLVAGSYTGPQQVIINCATEGATISYSTDGGSTWTVGNTVYVDKDMTIMAKAEKDGMTVSTTASATYVIITEEAPVTVNIKTGYYQIKNSGMYANVAGRKTLNFTDAPADKAGTVIYVDVENDGTVKSLRSQAADLQRYADRAMSYVPEVVKIVAQKLNADGSGEILGETGLGKILDKFNECFDHNLHVEQAQGGYRLYGKTPSMQPVVEFYRENKDKVEAKLPNLEAFINSALEKLKAKIGGSSVFTEFKLHDIWDKMGGTLTEPVDDASTMAFYREVLNNKNYVWDFAYQTAMIYVNNLMSHPRWPEVEDKLGEYAQYIDKIKQIRPEFKYYIVQKDGKPDFISEGNKDIIDNAERTIWTLEPRTDFTVNFPEANKHNGEYVTTLYTDFAYTLPEGVTAYTVTEVSTQGVATLTALEGTIPAQTPVLLKSTAYGPQTVTLSTEAGTAPADNLLVGPDYLIKHYEFKTPQVVDIFNFIKDELPGFYDEYVAQYEYLMLKTAGTVGNKYFWNVNSDLAGLKDDCIVRSLAVDENGTLAFSDHWTTETNKAFLVDDASNPQDVIKLPSLRGDINKDGVISIIDVTALIDILLDLPDWTYLNPTDTYPKGLDYEAADVNENKDIEITDVTTLIDILLNMPDQPAQGSGN